MVPRSVCQTSVIRSEEELLEFVDKRLRPTEPLRLLVFGFLVRKVLHFASPSVTVVLDSRVASRRKTMHSYSDVLHRFLTLDELSNHGRKRNGRSR
jgi:hypothetical protein